MREPLYLPKKRLQRATNQEVRELFSDIFSVTYPESNMIKGNILTALFYCTYLSVADLSYYLGMPEKSFKSLHKQLNDLEKSGLIKSVPLKTKDAFSKMLFYLTQNGFAMAAGFIGIPFSFTYQKRGKIVTTLHDYSLGLNALQLILCGFPFLWSKEVSYSASFQGVKSLGSLCVDGICDFLNTPYRLYIEEDLGYENIGILVGKLEKYYNYGLLRNGEEQALVYSFRQPYITCDAPSILAFSAKNVSRVMEWLRQENTTLNEAISRLKKGENNSEASALLPIMESLQKTLHLIEKRVDIGANYLEQYIKDLEELKLDIRVEEYNRIQEEFARSRFRSMAGVLVKHYRNNPLILTGFLSDLVRGFSVFCCSTPLFMNELPFYFYSLTGMEYTLAFCLKDIFPGLDPTSFKPLLEPRLQYSTGAQRILQLRNMFRFRDGIVCIEYLSRDLGAVVRFLRFLDYYKEQNTTVHIVCILENISDFYFIEKNLLQTELKVSKSAAGIYNIIFLDKSSLTDVPYFFTLDENHNFKKL